MDILDPGLKWSDSSRLRPLQKVEKLIQHHMAHSSWGILEVHRYHRDHNGWVGIGYNYWIGFNGDVYEGRGYHVGAHSGSAWNSRSLGIGYQGHFDYQKMTDQQWEAGAWLNAKLLKDNDLTVDDVVGHADVGTTACPGLNFRMEELKEKISILLKEEFSVMEKAIYLNSETPMDDIPAARRFARSEHCPIIFRGGDKFLEGDNSMKIGVLYVIGGKINENPLPDYVKKRVEEVRDLSGSDYFSTVQNVGHILKGR